jgi:hypothetical protein
VLRNLSSQMPLDKLKIEVQFSADPTGLGQPPALIEGFKGEHGLAQVARGQYQAEQRLEAFVILYKPEFLNRSLAKSGIERNPGLVQELQELVLPNERGNRGTIVEHVRLR